MEHVEPIESKKKVICVTLPGDLQKQVVDLARTREWSLAKAGSHLIKLGLEKLIEESGSDTQQPHAA
jgi:hypothetical protein